MNLKTSWLIDLSLERLGTISVDVASNPQIVPSTPPHSGSSMHKQTPQSIHSRTKLHESFILVKMNKIIRSKIAGTQNILSLSNQYIRKQN